MKLRLMKMRMGQIQPGSLAIGCIDLGKTDVRLRLSTNITFEAVDIVALDENTIIIKPTDRRERFDVVTEDPETGRSRTSRNTEFIQISIRKLGEKRRR